MVLIATWSLTPHLLPRRRRMLSVNPTWWLEGTRTELGTVPGSLLTASGWRAGGEAIGLGSAASVDTDAAAVPLHTGAGTGVAARFSPACSRAVTRAEASVYRVRNTGRCSGGDAAVPFLLVTAAFLTVSGFLAGGGGIAADLGFWGVDTVLILFLAPLGFRAGGGGIALRSAAPVDVDAIEVPGAGTAPGEVAFVTWSRDLARSSWVTAAIPLLGRAVLSLLTPPVFCI